MSVFKKTVDGVVANINKSVTQLHAVANRHEDEAHGHSENVAHFSKLQADATDEAARARRIAAKFGELIS